MECMVFIFSLLTPFFFHLWYEGGKKVQERLVKRKKDFNFYKFNEEEKLEICQCQYEFLENQILSKTHKE